MAPMSYSRSVAGDRSQSAAARRPARVGSTRREPRSPCRGRDSRTGTLHTARLSGWNRCCTRSVAHRPARSREQCWRRSLQSRRPRDCRTDEACLFVLRQTDAAHRRRWRASLPAIRILYRSSVGEFANWRARERRLRRDCPLCGELPATRSEPDPGRLRLLVCGCCTTRWRYRRTACPFCASISRRLTSAGGPGPRKARAGCESTTA